MGRLTGVAGGILLVLAAALVLVVLPRPGAASLPGDFRSMADRAIALGSLRAQLWVGDGRRLLTPDPALIEVEGDRVLRTEPNGEAHYRAGEMAWRTAADGWRLDPRGAYALVNPLVYLSVARDAERTDGSGPNATYRFTASRADVIGATVKGATLPAEEDAALSGRVLVVDGLPAQIEVTDPTTGHATTRYLLSDLGQVRVTTPVGFRTGPLNP